MKHIILTASSAQRLNEKIENHLNEGWKPIGSHKIVEVHHQLRYAGMQHKDTIIEREYSQTMQLEENFVSLLDEIKN